VRFFKERVGADLKRIRSHQAGFLPFCTRRCKEKRKKREEEEEDDCRGTHSIGSWGFRGASLVLFVFVSWSKAEWNLCEVSKDLLGILFLEKLIVFL
jgi:hypothetical protein